MAPPAPVVGVSLQHDGFAPGGTGEWARCLHLEFRIRGHVVIAVLSLAVLTGIGTPPADAQSDPVPWGGTVEVRGGPLSVKAGESVTYFLRLSEPPTADGWWVMVHVDGEVWGDVGYKGLSWVPSVGWGFDQDDWDVWRGITIRAADDAKLNTQVTFTHEVWDHTAECPVHDVGRVTVQVTDRDDSPPPDLPTLAIDDVAVNEDAGSAVFSVTLSEQSAETVTVGYGTLDGTATAGWDYTATNGTLTFLANETSKTIVVEVLDDSDVEGDETFLVRLSSPRNATVRDGEGTATIEGDDGTELPTLAIDDVAVNEDAGSAVFSVTLSEQSAETVTVGYGTLDGTAEAESDYTATNGTLTFLANETSKTIAVEVLDDSDVEGDETFLVRLSSPRNATLRDGEGEATIEGDDGTELPTLAIDDVAVNEDAGSAVFSVTLSEQSAETVTVGYGTLDGTAEAESDYTATNGTLTFLANETSKTIAVEVLDDSDVEGDETFLVRLSSPRNATVRDGEGTATIEGDDGTELPTLAIDDVAVNEDAGSAVFSVTLSEQSAETVTVGYGTLDGTAEAESDYTATNGTLTFLANETSKTIAVEVLDDSDVEGDETFLVRLSSPRNATVRDGEGEATIEGDDGTELPTLAIDDVAVNEDAGSAVR